MDRMLDSVSCADVWQCHITVVPARERFGDRKTGYRILDSRSRISFSRISREAENSIRFCIFHTIPNIYKSVLILPMILENTQYPLLYLLLKHSHRYGIPAIESHAVLARHSVSPRPHRLGERTATCPPTPAPKHIQQLPHLTSILFVLIAVLVDAMDVVDE